MTLVFDGDAYAAPYPAGRLISGLDRDNSIIRHVNCDSSGNVKATVV